MRLRSAVLEIGAFSGYSALAWYESTEATKAEIITLELDKDMIAATRYTLDKYNLNDRVKMMEGYASESIDKLSGEFDLVFVDANKDGYEGYCKQILDKKMLSPKGLIMCDNSEFTPLCFRSGSNPIHSLCSWNDHFYRIQPPPRRQSPSLLDRVREST